ncbi:acyl-coenzyme A thioesterase 13-like [Stegodyphus dumicola]|uniref:acyl-coenzyme A thioesterase 13-like n=1 Tax=Stegodyphus dumicola TaxID=202533 RepID=UPI0015A889AF|nr:acyl-coenzyme A thioesterase 13-like [Stegodyphus dumicola]
MIQFSFFILLPLLYLPHKIKKNCLFHGQVLLFPQKLEVMSAGAGQCVCELKIANEHKNRAGLLHGGMTSTLVDAVSTMALFSKIERPGVSIEMSVSFIRPANIGDELFIEGKILKVGKNLAFLTVDVKNKITGQIIAQGKHTKFVGEQASTATPSSTIVS